MFGLCMLNQVAGDRNRTLGVTVDGYAVIFEPIDGTEDVTKAERT